ncbi:MAG: SusC/RagA family TonB-linked outer membrane protein [Bacteroidaceae bacterium]|nr:SusC/RagA family TonB-linked outer membrane protein [Bacteroidaceae bacterium]
MKTLKYTLLIIMCLTSTLVSAQITRVSGTVSDEFGELPGVAVKEIDPSNRTVSATVTDGNGNFTMTLKDSKKNRLVFSCVGMKQQVIKPITKQVYKISMAADVKVMKEAVVEAKKMAKSSGLAIPEREVSYAAQGLDAKEFEGLGITSVDEALQGRIAGLDIIASSGNVGAGSQMRLRGVSTVSTLTSNEPLIVVNGDIATDLDLSDFDVATATDEKFAELLKVNTEDILDIRVLKDASATAIWGKNGANGVIEITTKRGQRGPVRVGYSGKVTIHDKNRPIKLLNGDQYTMMLKEAYFNPRLSDTDGNIPELNYDYEGFSEAYMYDNNTEWTKLVSKYGILQQHYINVQGGDEKTLFRISGGYDRETGNIIKQKMDRFSTRMALDYYVNDRIRINSDFSLTYTDRDLNYDGLWGIAMVKMPNLSPYYEYENGVQSNDYYYMLQTAAGGSNRLDDQKGLANPLASANLAKYNQRTYNLAPKLELQYKLLGLDNDHHQLNYSGVVYINVSNQYDDKDYPRELSTANFLNTHTAYSHSGKSLSFTTRHELTYIPYIKNRDHSIRTLGRVELNSGSSSAQSTNANRLPSGVSSPSAGGMITSMSSDFGQWKSLNYLFSGHYSYKSKYSVSGNLRMDGTTRFGPSKRWLTSYSISGRWNIIDENFMNWARESVKMSMLAVSAGWGVVGNQPGSDYLYMNKYSTGDSYLGRISMNPSGLKLTGFGPEKVSSWNVGVNLNFFDDRLSFRLDVYSRLTTGMLMGGAGITSTSGYSTLSTKNVGNMKNNGWEFNINGNRLLKKGKFSLDLYVNFANNHNIITKMDENVLEGLNTEFAKKNASLLQRVQINNPFGAIYGFRCHGTYQYNFTTAQRIAKGKMPEVLAAQGFNSLQDCIDAGITFPIALNANNQVIYNEKGEPLQMMFCYTDGSPLGRFNGGDAMYEDVNHDGQINELDLVYLGNSLPKLTGGFGFTLNYGHWRLSTQFNYRVDYDVFNMARLNVESMNNNNNQSEAVNYRWRKEGDGGFNQFIPRALSGSFMTNYNTLVSDRFVEDASFLRLNYLQLTYSFDSKLIKKWHLNQLKLSASARNLFCLTKYSGVDPEVGYGGYSVSTDNANTPGHARAYTFSLNIEF